MPLDLFTDAIPSETIFVRSITDWLNAAYGEGLKLLENWRGASFADLIHQTGFSEPGKGAPHGDEDTRFAAHT
jgi:hypothetical protein